MRIPLFHVNVFPHAPGSGNPAAVCLLNRWLDDELLCKVAAENSLPATAFLVPGENGYEIRWFSTRCELQLCGHATFASGYVVLNLLKPEWNQVHFDTRRKGNVSVRKHGELLAMDFPALPPKASANVPAALGSGLGIQASSCEVLEVNEVYVVVLARQTDVETLRPNFAVLEQLHPYAVSVSAPGKDSDVVSRYFAPGYGIPEDAVTGSAHCFLTPHWTKRLDKSRLQARQLSSRGGELWCEMDGDRVLLQGQARLTLRGSLEIRDPVANVRG